MAEKMVDALSDRLCVCTAEKLAKFDDLRSGRSQCPFWDIIVLTATDEAQAQAYSAIITQKLKTNEIPDARYHVFSDPPGPKIGNGGATMFALAKLEEICDDLDKSKVLLIHAGGFSKRLPNVSVTGKIFAALPFGEPIYTMLEMKLASYIEFPSRMAPGVFVTCADDIELIDCEGELEFTAQGFTALGHPSSLEIGTTHGVFVLGAASRVLAADAEMPPCTRAECSRFIHKPSIARMHELGAVIPGSDLVYTDSAYYFDRTTARKLHAFWSGNAPLACEIDAYGDFLQALGPAATDEYTRDSKNVIAVEGGLAETRMKLYHHLKSTPLTVILCTVSKFYHIGTVPEFLHHYCTDVFFRHETGAQHAAFVAGGTTADAGGFTAIHSVLDDGATVGKETVIEYSTINKGVTIGARCLVSNTTLPAGAVVPDETFLHTTRTKLGYVTIVFGTSEDLKTGSAFDRAEEGLTFCSVRLRDVLPKLGCTVADLWSYHTQKCTFWDARIWPSFKTVTESVAYALAIANAAAGSAEAVVEPPLASIARLTMEDILDNKDLEGILADREALRQKIAGSDRRNGKSDTAP